MGILRFLGPHSPVNMLFLTLFSGAQKVGEDTHGNVYYRAKPRPGTKRERRWVMYREGAEASMVPPEWHGWLHHQCDTIPSGEGLSHRRNWQKPHRPNMTGTKDAYRPPGHILEGGKRDKATGDYEAWQPPE